VTGSPAPTAQAPEPSDVSTSIWENRYPVQYKEWSESVHGTAYLNGNTDAPGCTDCHADPESSEITTASFRLEIPARCARCHADETLMSQYDIASDVYQTYQADYHGTTIEYFRAINNGNDSDIPAASEEKEQNEKQASIDIERMRYEAVCSDCHGSHAIYKSENPISAVSSVNLVTTCQKCHKDAESNVSDASMGHFRSDSNSSILLYIIKLFYLILIPVVVGGMLAFIGLDILHRLRTRNNGKAS
jgi:hypothetical protein